jgi:hypothetical protein
MPLSVQDDASHTRRFDVQAVDIGMFAQFATCLQEGCLQRQRQTAVVDLMIVMAKDRPRRSRV